MEDRLFTLPSNFFFLFRNFFRLIHKTDQSGNYAERLAWTLKNCTIQVIGLGCRSCFGLSDWTDQRWKMGQYMIVPEAPERVGEGRKLSFSVWLPCHHLLLSFLL